MTINDGDQDFGQGEALEAENKDQKAKGSDQEAASKSDSTPPPSSVDPLINREKFPGAEATPVAAAAATPDLNEISMENLDLLLGENDPAFVAQMAELQQTVVNDDVSIGANTDVLSEVAPEFETMVKQQNADHPDSKDFKTPAFKNPVLNAIMRLITRVVGGRFGQTKELRQQVLNDVREQAVELGSASKEVLQSYHGKQWIAIFGFCLTFLAMGFTYWAVQPLLDHWMKGDFFGNFDRVADHIYELGPRGDPAIGASPVESLEKSAIQWRTFRDPLEEFNFIVQYDRMIVNLKSSVNSTSNPMATFVIYLEGTSRETAVELKDRQMEIKDICQRVAESLSYDEFISAQGKRRFKNLVRKNVNEILNQGRLRAIYFETVIVKP